MQVLLKMSPGLEMWFGEIDWTDEWDDEEDWPDDGWYFLFWPNRSLNFLVRFTFHDFLVMNF